MDYAASRVKRGAILREGIFIDGKRRAIEITINSESDSSYSTTDASTAVLRQLQSRQLLDIHGVDILEGS